MPIQRIRPTFAFDEDRLAQLRAIVPEAFADGKINWDTLRETLGEYLEDEGPDTEYFGLFWPGKRKARRFASIPSKGTLIPQPGEGVKEDTTHNLFIEGENLEVLKLLQRGYAGRVKMIYIDPPYNTGQDFIYSDDYSEPLQSYLRRTGQVDEKGQLLTTNTRASGRFHSNWLSMMYPRLRLARQLLRDDGVIFVSIDDNEVHNLRLVMNEVFGEENHLSNLIWDLRSGTSAGHFTRAHEYIVVYAKDKAQLPNFPSSDNTPIVGRTTIRPGKLNPVSQIEFPAGMEFEGTNAVFSGTIGKEEPVKILSKEMVFENGRLKYPVILESSWRMRNQMISWISGKETFDSKGQRVLSIFFNKYGVPWYKKERAFVNPKSVVRVGSTKAGTLELENICGGRVLPFPKPSQLMKYLVDIPLKSDEGAIVLDFFAGSCTIAQALLELNLEDGGNRHFIMVQLPEPTDSPEFPTIADIGKERIRHTIAQIQAETAGQLDLHPGEDVGFKCYRLERSNFKPWQDYIGEEIPELQQHYFDRFETPLIENWQPADLLTEILLIEGFPLNSTITRQTRFTLNQVDLVTSDFHEHRLFVCLDQTIAPETIGQLDLAQHDIFVCLDSALTDESKLRLSDTGNIHVI